MSWNVVVFSDLSGYEEVQDPEKCLDMQKVSGSERLGIARAVYSFGNSP